MVSCKAEAGYRGPTGSCTFKTRTHMVLSQNNWSVIRFSSGVMVSATKSLDQTNQPGSVFILWNVMHMGLGLRVKQLHGALTNMPQKHIHTHTGGRQSKWQADGWKMNGWIRVLVVILGGVQWGWWVVNGVWACHAPQSELETTVRAPAIVIKGCHFSCVIKPSVLRSRSLELW